MRRIRAIMAVAICLCSCGAPNDVETRNGRDAVRMYSSNGSLSRGGSNQTMALEEEGNLPTCALSHDHSVLICRCGSGGECITGQGSRQYFCETGNPVCIPVNSAFCCGGCNADFECEPLIEN
jgi:hypothetical protein